MTNLPLDQITFCIKTIHRPWSCHRLVESLRKQFESPTIVVVDDGRPEYRFSEKYPETAKHCRVINLDTHDVGVGIGRNTAVGLFVTNGFFLGRHPDLPRALIDNGFRLDVSQHGNALAYRARFNEVLQRLSEWRAEYPALKITVRESHKGWRQQYQIVDGKPMPFGSSPRAAWNICLQRTCTQLYKRFLWKCPALAYFAMMERKLRLESMPDWQLFRDYQACRPTATDEEVRAFFATREIPQCGLCPSRKIPFRHVDPTTKGALQ